MILRELRMQDDIHIAVDRTGHARLTGAESNRSARDRLGIEFSVTDNAEAAGALSN